MEHVLTEREKMLGNEKIGSLLFKLSTPGIVSMFVGAVYNLVDAIFIGKGVNSIALGSLAIAFPLDLIVMSLALMFGLGTSSVVSILLGQRDKEKANHVAGNAVVYTLVCGVLLTALGLIFLDPILYAFGATPNLLPYAHQYSQILLYFDMFFMLTFLFNNVARSEGNPKIAMTSMLSGMLLNIALDPIFIFGFHMGVAGAAWATNISRLVSFVFMMSYMLSGKSILKIEMRHFKPDWEIFKRIMALGIPGFVRQVSQSFLAIVVNHVFKKYGGNEVIMQVEGMAATGGDAYITLFGIFNRLMSIVLMPLIGISQGLQPIVGYNFGAKQNHRIVEAVNKSMLAMLVFGTVMTALMMLFSKGILSVFLAAGPNRDILLGMGVPMMRILIIMTPFIGVQIVSSSLFQSVGRAAPAFFLSLLRQILLFIPLLLIFPVFWGVTGAMVAAPVSDLLSIAISGGMYLKEIGKFRKAADGQCCDEKARLDETVIREGLEDLALTDKDA